MVVNEVSGPDSGADLGVAILGLFLELEALLRHRVAVGVVVDGLPAQANAVVGAWRLAVGRAALGPLGRVGQVPAVVNAHCSPPSPGTERTRRTRRGPESMSSSPAASGGRSSPRSVISARCAWRLATTRARTFMTLLAVSVRTMRPSPIDSSSSGSRS